MRANENILQKLGRESLKLERELIKGAGFTAANDRLPAWMMPDPVVDERCLRRPG